MALNCADVPLRNYSLTQSLFTENVLVTDLIRDWEKTQNSVKLLPYNKRIKIAINQTVVKNNEGRTAVNCTFLIQFHS